MEGEKEENGCEGKEEAQKRLMVSSTRCPYVYVYEDDMVRRGSIQKGSMTFALPYGVGGNLDHEADIWALNES